MTGQGSTRGGRGRQQGRYYQGQQGIGIGQEYGGYGESGGEPYTWPDAAEMGYDRPANAGGRTGMGNGGPFAMAGPYTGRGPKGYQGYDQHMCDEACERLMRHGGVDASDVEVEVQGGEITLTGTVPDRGQKRMAEDAVESIPGVRDVHNQLTIASRGGRASSGNGQAGT